MAGGAPAADPTLPLSVSIGSPRRVTTDSAGNVYFTAQNAVYRLGNNVLTRIAGGLNAGYTGDGGNALAAMLNQPSGVVADSKGNVYVADTANHVIRVISNGIINTYAGNGTPGYTGDFGTPSLAQLTSPLGLALSSAGVLYIADTGNSVIRTVSADGGTIKTFAGIGLPFYSGDYHEAASAKINHPHDVTIDSTGNVYIADTGNGVIRKVDTTGFIYTVAGSGTDQNGDGGYAVSAVVSTPYTVAVDGKGNIFIGEYSTGRIRKVDTSDSDINKRIINTVAGTGAWGFSNDGGDQGKSPISGPFGISLDSSGNMFIADFGNNRIRKITGSTINTIAGNGLVRYSGDGGSALSAQLNFPTGLALDSSSNIYFSDQGNVRIRQVNSNGVISTIAGNGTFGFAGDGGASTGSQLNAPMGLALDASGNLYIADSQNQRVRKITNGTISTLVSGANMPTAVTVDKDGNVYYTVYQESRVRKLGTDGSNTILVGDGYNGYWGDGGPASQGELNGPLGLAVDANGNLYIADSGNNVIRRIATDGTLTTFAGIGLAGSDGDGGPAAAAHLASPVAIAFDASGNLFIAVGNRIREITTDGKIQTIAGTGKPGYSGDGGPAASALINGPSAIAVDAAGNVFFSDSSNNVIRKLTPVQ